VDIAVNQAGKRPEFFLVLAQPEGTVSDLEAVTARAMDKKPMPAVVQNGRFVIVVVVLKHGREG
jgi:hypothetical protein